MIRFCIVRTKLGNEPRFVARVQLKEGYDQKKLVDRMLEIGTSVSRNDLMSVLNLLATTVTKLCAEGCSASLDEFVRFSPTIGGTFDGEGDGFQAGRNQAYVNATVSSVFNTRFSQMANPEKARGLVRMPKIFAVNDVATETTGQKVTPADIVTLKGANLKFDIQEADEYLRFVNADQPAEAVVITRFQKVSESELVFLMPEVVFDKGYFELASSMGATKIRTEKSPVVEVVK